MPFEFLGKQTNLDPSYVPDSLKPYLPAYGDQDEMNFYEMCRARIVDFTAKNFAPPNVEIGWGNFRQYLPKQYGGDAE